MNALRHAIDGVSNCLNQAARDQEIGTRITLDRQDVLDAAELIQVLRRMVEGTPPLKAFGAPGDWGYNHPIGKALVAHLTSQTEEPR